MDELVRSNKLQFEKAIYSSSQKKFENNCLYMVNVSFS
jgi:hypothetical protein